MKELDKSNYIKGILALIGKRNVIEEPVQNSIKYIAEILDFNQQFIDESLKDLTVYNSSADDLPKFSDNQLAESFLKDSMHIAFSDGSMNIKQVEWLINTAKKNRLSEQWIFIELEEYITNYKLNLSMSFEIQRFLN
ncbi:MAG TPA: hypothetical protein VMT35_01590 [Ignavibacteriaceae bacterium]|nr:hypothetical protein [Ignavibacteriaceae bacterium]